MRHHQVVIVGGGPAGAACAWKLIQAGVDCLILDKQTFPRSKTCAGWITPGVFKDLNLNPAAYPHDLTAFPYLKIFLNKIPIHKPGKQYAIRRIEFDHWLLERSRAPVITHEVRKISFADSIFTIDDIFSAEYLIGAGGTHCPLYAAYFRKNHPRSGSQIIALEEEYQADWEDKECRLWFFDHGLPGYAWYVPKTSGYLNIGVGGNTAVLKQKGSSIQEHWDIFLNKLKKRGLIGDREFKPDGYVYYLRGENKIQSGNLFLVGDAAGLATLDMGEGIGPAIRSGILAAETILGEGHYNLERIPQFSLLPALFQWIIK
jgi:flavin-dependent dehydrogenase